MPRKTLKDRIRAALGHSPSAPQQATYEERSASTSFCTFITPARGWRDHTVRLSVDEIEDLILAASAAKEASRRA